MKKIVKALWQFCSYVFVPQWGRKRYKMSDVRHRQVGHGTVGLRETSSLLASLVEELPMVITYGSWLRDKGKNEHTKDVRD